MPEEILPISGLFSGQKQYKIPRYQRRYVWDVTNWDALWRDLTQLQGKKHFTGTIVTKPETEEGSSPTKKDEIIDGQQRLATFQIIFCVIRDLCASKAYTTATSSQIQSTVDGFTKLNLLEMEEPETVEDAPSDAKDGFSPYRLLITKERDREAFQSVVAGNFQSQIKEAPNVKRAFRSLAEGEQLNQNLIVKAYGYFGMKITGYLDEKGSDKLLNLTRALSYNFYVMSAKVGLKDDPQQIFGSINGTGRALDEFDLLRNDLFLRVENRKKQNNLYQEYWRHFDEESFWEEAGRTDEFLRFFLTAKLGPTDFRKKRLFHDVYKGQYHEKLRKSLRIEDENNPKFVKTEFEELAKYAKSYQEMENPITDIGHRRQFYKDLNSIFEDLDITSLPPFILYVKNELELDDNERDQVYKILESYTLRCQLRHGVNEDKTTFIKIDNLFAELVNGGIKEPRIAEAFAKYLSDANKAGRSWLGNQAVLHSFRRVGDQMDSLSRSLRRPIWDMLRYIFYRIERLKEEKTAINTRSVRLSFNDFFSQYILIKPLPKSRDRKTAYSIGNLTFCKEHLSVHLPFADRKVILLREPNSNLILNKEMTEYSEWTDLQIREREKNLLACLYEIWPSAEDFSRKTTIGRSSNPTIQPIIGEVSKSKIEPRWIAMTQLDEYQPIRFVTYSGEEELAKIKIFDDKVIGLQNNNERRIERSNILFACSASAWPEVEPYIETLDYVKKEQLKPTQNHLEQLEVKNWLLKSVQEAQVPVIPVTRYGHSLEGTIEDFDEDAIYMQIREHTVIVYRDSIYEFAVEELQLHEGMVTYFDESRGYGFIKSSEHERIYVHISQVLDRTIDELQQGQKVEFDLNQTTKGGGLSAINVEVVED